jgi:hypothetical protein
MNYRIKRGDQEFGPYSLADLQQYVLSGHVLTDDLAQSEGMSEWIPVAQILGDIPILPASQPGIYAGLDSNAEFARQIVPLPPNLPWPVLLLTYIAEFKPFQFLAIFSVVWSMIQANWARKLSGKNTALVLMCMYPAGLFCGVAAAGVGGVTGNPAFAGLGGLLIFAGIICLIIGNFKIRDAMEEYYNTVEDISLSLSGVMIFFFGIIYIQFHINRIARWKKTGVLS